MDTARAEARGTRRGRDGVDVDRAREPLTGAGGGLDAVPCDLHVFLLLMPLCSRRPAALASDLDRAVEVPLPDASVDVVISNCVINLAEDKGAVIREAFRVLKPGGRFAVSDRVELRELPAQVKRALDAWAGCIAGTIPVHAYRQHWME